MPTLEDDVGDQDNVVWHYHGCEDLEAQVHWSFEITVQTSNDFSFMFGLNMDFQFHFVKCPDVILQLIFRVSQILALST